MSKAIEIETGRRSFDPRFTRKFLGLDGFPAAELPLTEKERLANMLFRNNGISKDEIMALGMKVVPAEEEEIR